MITPRFELSQTASELTVTVHAKYVRSQAVSILVASDVLHFHAHPYFLRLSFPHSVQDAEDPPATYDADTGMLNVTLAKCEEKLWADLDLLSKFLPNSGDDAIRKTSQIGGCAGGGLRAPVVQEVGNSVVEVMEGVVQADDGDPGEARDNARETEDLDWHFPQTLHPADGDAAAGGPSDRGTPNSLITSAEGYGFLQQHRDVFKYLQEDYSTLFDFTQNPEETLLEERRMFRRAHEDAAFSPDHYMADFMQDREIKEFIQRTDVWWKQITQSSGVSGDEEVVIFSQKEKDLMVSLKYKEYLIDDSSGDELCCYLFLIDLLFAYCYERRVADADDVASGEHGSESSWLCAKLSIGLSSLDTFKSLTVQDVITSSVRRSLAFPLYRHYGLAVQVWKDVTMILGMRRRGVLRALLWLKDLFDHDDLRYRFSVIALNPLCNWVLSLRRHRFIAMAKRVEEFVNDMTKGSIGWRLAAWEKLAPDLDNG